MELEERAVKTAEPKLKVQGVADMATYKRGFTFYMVFVANLVVDLLSAMDLVRRRLFFHYYMGLCP